jgi:hypothetical protein
MMATALLQAIGIGIGFLIGTCSKTIGDNVYRLAVLTHMQPVPP